eukprot:6173921-Pleurochrysis_carterae.AAC.1
MQTVSQRVETRRLSWFISFEESSAVVVGRSVIPAPPLPMCLRHEQREAAHGRREAGRGLSSPCSPVTVLTRGIAAIRASGAALSPISRTGPSCAKTLAQGNGTREDKPVRLRACVRACATLERRCVRERACARQHARACVHDIVRVMRVYSRALHLLKRRMPSTMLESSIS